MTSPYTLIGGGTRAAALARLLVANGQCVDTYLLETPGVEGIRSLQRLNRAGGRRTVVLPLAGGFPQADPPLTHELLSRKLRAGDRVFGFKITPEQQSLYQNKGIDYRIPALDEAFAIRNAVPTAEGALMLALQRMDCTLHRSCALVLGGGRVGKALCQRLIALGAKTVVFSENAAERAYAQSLGAHALLLDDLPSLLPVCHVLFNTIPAPVVGAQALSLLSKRAVVLDLASAPGGVDHEAARGLGLHCEHALDLPGRTAPETAASILYQTLTESMKPPGGT